MYDLMACYRVLHAGGELSVDCESAVQASDVQPHQLAALAFQLGRKTNLNQAEISIIEAISRSVPDAAYYLIPLFDGNLASEIMRRVVPNGSGAPENSLLLENTSRQQQIGAPRIANLISGFLTGGISIVFMAIWLMKVCYDGLSDSDVEDLTLAMRDSGRVFDYRKLPALGRRRIIRRYPTGALSEKTALILPSLLSVFRFEYPLASPFLVARSLGFTGGTWDKLRAIPGFQFPEQGTAAIDVMRSCGVAISVTQGDFNPADREMYKLRSMTGTIQSRELIVASIASKQLGVPADRLLLDIRYGSGAFLPSLNEAEGTARQLVEVIENHGVPCVLSYTDTAQPNGMAVGNALEVLEAVAVMGAAVDRWDGRALIEQKKLVISLFSELMAAEFGKEESWWRDAAEERFKSGDVYRAFLKLLGAHGVPKDTVEQIASDPAAVLLKHDRPRSIAAKQKGQLTSIDQRKLGELVNFGLGGGGNEYGGEFDPATGVVLKKRLGDRIEENEPICLVYAGEETFRVNPELCKDLGACFKISQQA